jgi:hypothetical protein
MFLFLYGSLICIVDCILESCEYPVCLEGGFICFIMTATKTCRKSSKNNIIYGSGYSATVPKTLLLIEGDVFACVVPT